MRKRFEQQISLNQTPIEKVQLPRKSRDELPPILAGLQWIFVTPGVNEKVFALLEEKILQGKKRTGRTGMDLWQMLVLGVIRLGLDADYDRLEHVANYDSLVRQMLGAEDVFGQERKVFHYQTLRDNVSLIDGELLEQINAVVAQEGRRLFKKKEDEPIAAKTDSYVLETNVHFPTDLNLLWDGGRKCVELLAQLEKKYKAGGWRKASVWKRKLKSLMRSSSKAAFGGGKNKEERARSEAQKYLAAARDLSKKVQSSIHILNTQSLDLGAFLTREQVIYFHKMLDKHIDLVERRLLRGETIPAAEKIYSLFEPHTEWINKGKTNPAVELGHKMLVTTDQYDLVLDYKVMEKIADVEESLPVAHRLWQRYGEESLGSLSFDKNFSKKEIRVELEKKIPRLIMPKKGRKNAAETERENDKIFKHLRHKHSAIESAINALEHHGLDRCPDKGLAGYKRYVGFGVLSYNLHKIGKRWQELGKPRQRQRRAA